MAVTGIRCNTYYNNIAATERKYNKEALNFSEVLKSYEEKNKLTADNLKETDDWRTVSDEAWDKLLESIDNYIDFRKEMNREMVERQLEAAQKAARQADAGMKTIAASQAALAVASCGFYNGNLSSDVGEHSMADDTSKDNDESDWTHMISTDDQVLLRKARMAQDTEMSAKSRIEEIKTGKITEGSSPDISAFALRKEDKEAIEN